MSNHGDPRKRTEADPRLSRASVGRLSLYLRRLEDLQAESVAKVSSGLLGEALGLTDTQVRKDLASLGRLGHPGIGYDVHDLITAIRATLGIDREWTAALVGVGNLGQALLRYQGLAARGFRIVCLFDTDPVKVGQVFEGLIVHPAGCMAEVIPPRAVELGILTVPASSAQNVAEDLIAAGVRGLLNFAPSVVRAPAGIGVVNVDLAMQLEQLAFLVHMTANERLDAAGTR